jgi:hypothetical protein
MQDRVAWYDGAPTRPATSGRGVGMVTPALAARIATLLSDTAGGVLP